MLAHYGGDGFKWKNILVVEVLDKKDRTISNVRLEEHGEVGLVHEEVGLGNKLIMIWVDGCTV